MERKHKFLIQRLTDFVFEVEEDALLERIKASVAFLAQQYSRSSKEFLNYFWFCLQKVYHQKYATIEYTGHIDLKAIDQVLRTAVNFDHCKITSVENPKLIGGFKIKCGDNVLDYSLETQLKELVNTLR